MSPTHQRFLQRLAGAQQAIAALEPLLPVIANAADALVKTMKDGGTIHTCGNGGSAAQAMHLAEELIGRYRGNRPPLPAICLNADPTALTCIANDFGFEQVFARQCEALVTERDALVVFSTSGNSRNCLNALEIARRRGALAVALLGRDGGSCAAACTPGMALTVAAADSAHIQEAHQVILHLICEAAEQAFGQS